LRGDLKATLARFLEGAEVRPGGEQAAPHRRIQSALRWAAQNFPRRDALSALRIEAGMSRNYFSKLFAGTMRCTPQEYIERLHLRRARYLIRKTNWQLKRIAAEVGYDDPLYFSRRYRAFWKRPPSGERQRISCSRSRAHAAIIDKAD
jgi:transcriptional regulator GlxA family with amidase domain